MGQKINPIGFRLAVNKDWRSKWYASGKDYTNKLHEDLAIRGYLKSKLVNAGLARVVIERAWNSVRVTLHTSRPGLIIGRQGKEIEVMTKDITSLCKGAQVKIDIIEIRKPELDAQLVAEHRLEDWEAAELAANLRCPECDRPSSEIYCGPAPAYGADVNTSAERVKKQEKVNMSDDLVERLRIGIHTSEDVCALRDEAADRIETLVAALSLSQDWIKNRASHAGDFCTSNQCICGKALVLFNARKALDAE